MRIDKRIVAAITTVLMLQGVFCSVACLAGAPAAAATQEANAAATSEHASSHAEEPCHQGRRGTPQDVPAQSDDWPACSSCSCATLLADTTSLAYTAEKDSAPIPLTVIASTSAVAPIAMRRLLPPLEPEHVPPPARLYLLNSSFLI